MKYGMNNKGELLNENGEVVKIDDEPVIIRDAVTQETLNNTLAKQKDTLRTLKEAAAKAPELEEMVKQLTADKEKTEAELARAQDAAQEKVATQINGLTKKAETLEQKLKEEQQARLLDQVENLILASASESFINPKTDVVPHLLRAHKREPRVENGKQVEGQFVDTFQLSYKDDKGVDVTEYLPLDKALEVWGKTHSHHMKPINISGSGGGKYDTPTGANPFDPKNPNVTQQHQLIVSNPTLAKQLAAAVGVKLNI
jgi:hypothetical protein